MPRIFIFIMLCANVSALLSLNPGALKPAAAGLVDISGDGLTLPLANYVIKGVVPALRPVVFHYKPFRLFHLPYCGPITNNPLPLKVLALRRARQLKIL